MVLEYLSDWRHLISSFIYRPTKPHVVPGDVTAADYPEPHPAGPLDDKSESSSGFGSLTRKEKTTGMYNEKKHDFGVMKEYVCN